MKAPFMLRMFCLILVMSLVGSAIALAAPFEFSATAKKSFDKIVDSASASAATQLKKNYAELQSLQKQDINFDTRISSLRYKNQEKDTLIRKQIKEIDKSKIASLDGDVAKAKQRYKPLFDLYDTQRSQLSLAKAAKNKELTSIVNAKVQVTKIAVQAAKKDISAKEAAVKKAKSDATAKTKAVRDILDANKAIESRIKAAKSAASQTKKLFTAESKVLLQTVRGGDGSGTSSSLSRMLVHIRQILINKTNIHYYETQIASVIAKAETKLKSY
ncbi:hypothetical protein [Paenibacillus paeoniae]|uniref:Uncharacterized protein n=1 Tax=Paenibacillus paeoniae TaxID=2292705 RepID=A0A371PEL8_9BACL|nr:hypothetical protein [Paenibacillus paeoniae]REK74329.1 hypothetical protein DX130_17520 [Paenibacillus paeoniae]